MADKFFDPIGVDQMEMAKLARQSRAWFNNQALALTNARVTSDTVMKSDPKKLTYVLTPGYMYMFRYDPKTKEKLPYWDTFPLVLPWGTFKGGFIGLNLHYLRYKDRVVLLNRLMEFANDDSMKASTKIQYSWKLIANASKFQSARPCVKQYLLSHLQSSFRKVESRNWSLACMLPVQQFQKRTQTSIWNISSRSY